MRTTLRALASIGAFVIITAILFVGMATIGGAFVFSGIDGVLPPLVSPAIGPVSYNTNTDVQLPLFLPISLAGGAIAASIAWDPKVSRKRELALTIFAFFVLAAFSGYNFMASDRLLRRSAQAVLDLVMAATGGALLVSIFGWKPTRAIAISLRALSIFLLTGAGVVLPLVYAIGCYLPVFGYRDPIKDAKEWVELLAAMVSLAVAWFSAKDAISARSD